jgi:putative transposase
VARKWDYSQQRQKVGRPPVGQEIVELVLRMAKENPSWGYDRIQSAVANLGHRISDSTVANILRQHDIDPAPERKRQTTWNTFLKAHWDVLASVDFTTIEVWTRSELVTCYLLFFMQLATRRVHLAGLTTNPDEAWLLQIARNVTDAEEGFLRGKRYILMDRDTQFSEVLRNTLEDGGVKPVRLLPRSPNLNSHIERFLRSLKEECLAQIIFFGEKSLHSATVTYLEHFHSEQNRQGMGNRLLIAGSKVGQISGEVKCRERLGGLLRYYYRNAA